MAPASRRALATERVPAARAASVAGMVRSVRVKRVSCSDSVRVTSARARSQQAKE